MAGGFDGASIHAGGITLSESKGYSHWRLAARRFFSSLAIVAATLTASASLAATTTVSVLLDIDNSVGTGCSVTTSDGPVLGVDKILRTIVQTNSTGYSTQSISVESCITGSTFSAPNVFNNTPSPIARGNGVGGLSAVETYIPNYLIPAAGKVMRVAVTTDGSAGLVGTDSLLVTSTGQAILVDGPVANVIPTLSIAALALTMLLVGGAVWYARRRGWAGMQLVVVCVVALSLSGSLIAAIVRDGLVVDWTGIAPVATDPSGDAPAGMDIANLYSVAERDAVFFRADVALNAPPVADAQSVVAVAAVALPITLTGSDYEASALTYTLGASPAHGALTGTPPNLTYTATAGYGGPDSFTFKVNDGQLDSTFATVTIDVKLPPTITSANNATFIPGQANTFSFTATGVPSANFAVTVCALPPSVTLTNNGDNTATLSGNPTVAQGGTYVCTVTATNGFGAPATQTFTLNLGLPPTFTSATATSFVAGTAGSFTVTTTATPTTTSMTQTGALPSGVTFTYNGPGTPLNATLAGTPAPGTGGTYPLTFTAGNGIPPNSVQNFVLTVNQAPAVTSANSLTCVVGVACSLPIAANGFPLPTIAVGGAALPSGMTFAPGTLGNGLLSGTPAVGGAGTYAITFTASNGTAPNAVQNFTLTVNPASTTTALTSATNPSVFGQSVTFTATVTPQGTGVPAGTVTFNDGATAICSNVTLDGSAQATCTTSSLSTATHSMTAVYAGNTSFTTSTSPAVSQVVNKGSTTTAVTSSANPSNFAQSVTFSATVSATAPSAGTPSGTVTFKDGATTVCGPVALVAAAATCATSTLTVGSHSITVDYAGDANFNTSTSAALNQVVNKTDTTNGLVVAPVSPTVFGQSIALTSTVAAVAPGGGVPTGTVTFLDGATSIGSGALNGAGVATAATTTLAVGTHSLTANYTATTNYNASTSSPAISFVVNKASTTASTPTSTPNPSVFGQSVTFSSTVSVTAPGAGTPTGSITFKEGATTICTGTIAAGTASCSTSTLAVGAHSVTATYDGDTNFLASSASAALTHNVNKANSAGALATSVSPSAFGNSVTFTVTLSATAPGAGTPGGTVTFLDNSIAIGSCTGVAVSAAVATCTLSGASALATGTHLITASYSGDANFNTSTSNSVSQVVTALATATALASSLNPSQSGNSVTFMATVASSVTVNAGNVQFLDGASTLCTVAVNASGSATCTTSALTAGSHAITAAYLGATNFNASTSAALTQIVNQAPGAIGGAATITFPIATATSSTYTATGFPAPTFALSGCPTLPAAITLSSAGVLSGTAPVGSGGTYNCTVTASNGIGSPTSLPITININLAPSFTSATTTTFVVGSVGSFAVTANGSPAPTFSTVSPLPGGVTLTSGGALSGTPNAGTGGSYPLSIVATNGVAPDATQSFTLLVNQAPTIGAIGNISFTVGVAASNSFVTTGFPLPTNTLSGCTLPAGLTLSGNTIGGTASVGATSVTGCVVTASNAAGSASTAPFNVSISQPPTITSGNSLTCLVGTPCSLSVAATGTPAPTLSLTGTLPSGITFTAGTGALGGTAAATTGGTYALTIGAANGVLPNATQSFTLTVNEAPTAVADSPALVDANTVVTGAVSGATNLISNDTRGFPLATILSYGGGSLGGAVTDHAAGSTTTFGTGGSITVNANGSYSFTPSTNFTGTFTFQYRLSNAGGTSDATVTLQFRPKAVNDTLVPVVVGNVSINSASLTTPLSILTNDAFTGPVTVNVGALSLQGGNISVAAGGSFTYDPPAGYEGADSFSYTLTDASGFTSTSATVNLAVSGMIWFVNNNAISCTTTGCGRLSNPYSTLAAFNAANGVAGVSNPAANDNIFIYESATAYTGAVSLLSGQKLIGQDATATLAAITGLTPPTGSAALPAMSTVAPATTIGSTVTLNTNTTVRGLSISSGTATGLADPAAATTGVNVSEVSVASTTGTAVSLSNLAGSVSLTSVSANGGVNGISLTNTTGSFTVTGTAAANSGGTIQNTTGPGVSLATVQNVSLGKLTIQNITAASGVNGTGVTNFSFTNGTISNTGNAVGHSNIAFNGNGSLTGNNLNGNFTVTGSTLTNAFDHGIQVQGDDGTINIATITGNTITSTTSTATSKGSAIQLIGNGNGSTAHNLTRALIDVNTISNFPSGAGIQVLYGNASATGPGGRAGTNGSGTDKIVITNNAVAGQSPVARLGTSAILFSVSGGNSGSRSQGNADISNNQLFHSTGTTLAVGNNGFSDASVTANGNTVNANNSLTNAGIGGGNGGVLFNGSENPSLTVTVSGNTTTNTSGQGIFFVSRSGGGAGVLRAKIQNNNVSAISTGGGNRAGIQIDAGNTLGVNDNVCLNISGNTSVGSGVFTQGISLRRQTPGAGVVFGVNGMAATGTPGVEAFVDGLNPAGNGTLLQSATSGFSNCSFP